VVEKKEKNGIEVGEKYLWIINDYFLMIKILYKYVP